MSIWAIDLYDKGLGVHLDPSFSMGSAIEYDGGESPFAKFLTDSHLTQKNHPDPPESAESVGVTAISGLCGAKELEKREEIEKRRRKQSRRVAPTKVIGQARLTWPNVLKFGQ